jgi:putative sigma-54 modulation protein
MKIEITGRHLVVTPALRTYVLKRLRKFTKLCGEDTSFHVIIDVEKDRHAAEIVLKSKLFDITGKGQTGDMYSSILQAVEKLERQALKRKSRRIEAKRQRAQEEALIERAGRSRVSRRALSVRDGGIFEEEAPKKPMSVEEAVIEMDHSEYPFVVFTNVDTGVVEVIYRRKDGNLAVVRG